MAIIYEYLIKYCLLLVFIVLIKLLFKKKMPSSLYKLLWLICMVRLTIPLGVTINILHPETTTIPLSDAVIQANSQSHLNTSAIIIILYLIGAAVTLMKFFFDYRKVDFIAKSSLPLTGGLEKGWTDSLGINKKTEIRYSDELLQPFAYGVFKPKIILPQSLLTDIDSVSMDYIITHEMTHIKQQDVLIKRWSTILCALHWFNPLVWLLDHLLSEDIEKACDEVVIQHFGLSKRQEYAELLLLNAIKGIDGNGQASLVSSPVADRIKSIMKLNKPQQAIGVYLVTIGTALLFLISLLGYSQEVVGDVVKEQPIVEDISEAEPVTGEVIDIIGEPTEEPVVVEEAVSETETNFPTLKSEDEIGQLSAEQTKQYLEDYSQNLTTYLEELDENE
ncbi:M56 family metallopeptidase [Vagococcus sp. BWB3-3]|uniref:M56 family metallopeptidase n=1 Tax=Vagococcus allomyrinae TaxID=2794353 RepID=A0A940PBW0_9ENTE|nr:M56 family metallopeptidase [Vagococcus allomyrinae]MBP1042129.1 M56 family metallopeptidase [Vagococcus allomyrinae]